MLHRSRKSESVTVHRNMKNVLAVLVLSVMLHHSLQYESAFNEYVFDNHHIDIGNKVFNEYVFDNLHIDIGNKVFNEYVFDNHHIDIGNKVFDEYVFDNHQIDIGNKVFDEYVFDNHHIDISDKVASAMGTNFIFATTDTDSKPKVEDTFDDKKNADDRVRIFLRSSLGCVSPAAITKEEVRAALEHWSDPIKNHITKNYFEDGDYVAATKVASVRYDYGNTNVLFNQTEAEGVQFR
eukprot:1598355-Amphidinium_carterae.1